MSDQPRPKVLRHTAHLVAAHLAHNQLAPEALPQLIQSVYQALSGLGTEPEPAVPARAPAVPVRKSVFPDHLVCLEDGAKMKTLKRYLQRRFGLTPAEYRERWGLPADYPMVAPEYTKRRSAMAKQIGLGRKKASVPQEADTTPAPLAELQTEGEVTVTKVAARRARGVKK